MPILGTAKQHFNEDIQRARAIHCHAVTLVGEHLTRLKDDLLRSAWMMGVGANDAFFCDAYADLMTRTLRAKACQDTGNVSDNLENIKVPLIAILNTDNSFFGGCWHVI